MLRMMGGRIARPRSVARNGVTDAGIGPEASLDCGRLLLPVLEIGRQHEWIRARTPRSRTVPSEEGAI